MNGPRQQLAETGQLGPEGARLVYRTVAAVAAARNFPPPPGSDLWDDSAITETAHDMLDGARGAKRLADALLRSTDESSFARVLEGATVNYLRDVARATDLGKVVRRVAEILRSCDDFVEQGGSPVRWGLPEAPTVPSTVGPDALARAAGEETHVVVPAWNSDRRDAPIADRASLIRILTRVLSAAEGGVTAAEAARAVASRIEVRRSPLTVQLDTLERVAEPAALADPAVEAAVGLDAARLFGRLDDRERILLAYFHEPLDLAARRVAVGRSQTALLRQRLISRLQQELGVNLEDSASNTHDATAAMLTARMLRDLCTAWVEDRTSDSSATSHTGTTRSRADGVGRTS